MAVARSRVVASRPPEPEQNSSWSPAANPAVTALLDHLAEELAQEYVRLMEHAAHEEQLPPTPSRQEA